MVFNNTEAIERLKSPLSKYDISAVKMQESELRVFTEEMSEAELQKELYWGQLMARMKSRSQKKFDRVKEFARYPLPVVQLSDSVLNDFFKVFEGKNRYFNIDGDRDVSRLKDWTAEVGLEEWIEEHARLVFKNKPNSFVVVDVDTSGVPYLIFVDSNRLIDAQYKNNTGELEYICFIHSMTTDPTTKKQVVNYGVYDEETYFVFSKSQDQDEYTTVSENKHTLGRCPARSFITTPSNTQNNFKRRVAFSSALSKMEDWTLFDIFRNYVDHYAPFPVTEAPVKRCANQDCQDGKIASEFIDENASVNAAPTTVWSDCPVCKGVDQGQHVYPGTHIGIKVSPDKTESDGSGVFKMIFPETDKLKYVPEKLDDLELEIRYKTAGLNTLMSNDAFNELQVKGSFASMETILLRTKMELDHIYKWVAETVGGLFYRNSSLKIEANYGTEWYLVTEEDLQARFKEAKSIGLPMEELEMIYLQLIETKYKGNENKIKRQKMLLMLDPLPLYSNSEAINMKSLNIIDSFDLNLKMNFLNFIAKFENENAPITQFGLNLELWQRVERIKEILNIYNNENIASKQLEPSTGPTEET